LNAVAARRPQRGVSIIEALITVGIISLVLTLTVRIFTLTVNDSEKTRTDLSAESEARMAMTKVTNDLRQAMPPYKASGTPVTSPVYPGATITPTPQPAVTFTEVDSLSTANYLAPTFDYVTIQWDSAKSRLERCVAPNSQTICTAASAGVVANDVTAFSVLPQNYDEYQITLTVAPQHRSSVSSPPYTLVSSMFISYYDTNYSPGVQPTP